MDSPFPLFSFTLSIFHFFLGALLLVLWQRRDQSHSERFIFAVSCGLIVGEGLGGLVQALLVALNVPSLV